MNETHTHEESSREQDAAETLLRWLASLRLGAPLQAGALAVIPLHGEAMSGPPYVTLADGIAAGSVLVTEQPDARVPTLQVVNRGAVPVLVLDGEEVAGGRQNRVVNTTLLVPAKTAFPLPVTCVEQGRWHEERPTFGAGEAAYPSLRQQKARQVTAAFDAAAAPVADQHAVWAEVARGHARMGTHSATHAMRDAYAERDAELRQAAEELRCPRDGVLGVVALVGGRAVCADVFDRAEASEHYWPRLVRSYAVEAIGAPARPPRVDSAERLLRRPLGATHKGFQSPGLGVDLRIEGNGVAGAALVHQGAVLHTALFRVRGGAGPALRPPSTRMRRFAR